MIMITLNTGSLLLGVVIAYTVVLIVNMLGDDETDDSNNN